MTAPKNLIRALFQHPSYSSPRISHCNTYRAHIAITPGEYAHLVITHLSTNTTETHQLPFKKPDFHYEWCYDTNYLLILCDPENDEQKKLFRVNRTTGTTDNLTPYGVAKSFTLSPQRPDTVAVILLEADVSAADVFHYTISTGSRRIEEKNNGSVFEWVIGSTLTARARTEFTSDGSLHLHYRPDKQHTWLHARTWDRMSILGSHPVAISPDDSVLYFTDYDNNEYASLLALSLTTGDCTTVEKAKTADFFEQVIVSKPLKPPTSTLWLNSSTLSGFSYREKRIVWSFLAPIPPPLHNLLTNPKFDSWIEQETEHAIIIGRCADTHPPEFWCYTKKDESIAFLASSRPALKVHQRTFAHTTSHTIIARDDMKLHAYLTLPKHNQTGKEQPLIIKIHGGPWSRDLWGFNPEVQLLSQKGYAILQVNYRGSIGYGKTHLNKGRKKLGCEILKDLIDAANWAIERGYTTKEKLAFMGRSYGGYAALSIGWQYPEYAQCILAHVPPTNMWKMVSNPPKQWRLLKNHLIDGIGNNKEELLQKAPERQAHKISCPLYLSYNTKDIRISSDHAHQLIKSINPATPLTVDRFSNEGHFIHEEENLIAYASNIDAFLDRFLKVS